MAPALRRLSDSFADIQGNILVPFKRRYQYFVFLSFHNRRQEAREWLTEIAEHITPTTDMLPDGNPRDPLMTISLTSSALVMLHPELAPDVVSWSAFWKGAEANGEGPGGSHLPSAAQVGDSAASDPSGWIIGGPGKSTVDAVITVAGDDEGSVTAAVEHQFELIETVKGEVLPNGTEHFGFKDGISQPGISGFSDKTIRNGRLEVKDDKKAGTPIIAAGEFVLGYEPEPGSYPASSRPAPPRWMYDGSFQVFLRLVQDVEGWNNEMTAATMQLRNIDVAAKAIGRQRDGTPLALRGAEGPLNDFQYRNDPDGFDTPKFAHIRKMNPRDDAPYWARTHQLLRRGIPFGPPAGEGQGERGLAFNAYMASIEGQFEFLMRQWANNPRSLPDSPAAEDGPDPVVGANTAPCVLRREEAPGESVDIDFGRFVHTTGAVYAFTPSISTLRLLGAAQSIPVGSG